MGKGSAKRALRKRIDEVSSGDRDVRELGRAAARRIAKLEKDLAAAQRREERRRSRLASASAEADRIRGEIAGILQHATDPAIIGARKVGHAAGDLIEDAAGAVVDAAGGVVRAAESVVGAAKRARSRSRRADSPATDQGPDHA